MEQIKIYKDLANDVRDYLTKHPDLLPSDVNLSTMNIRANAYKFYEEGREELFDWEVIFLGDLGNPQIKRNYDLVYEGLRLISMKNSSLYN